MTQTPRTVELEAWSGEYAVCRLASDAPIPDWVPMDAPADAAFVTVSRTREELSIVCPANAVPTGVQAERDWACFKVAGPLDFSEIGILSALAAPLAAAGVGIFVVSTFDTDYLLVKTAARDHAIEILTAAGHTVAG